MPKRINIEVSSELLNFLFHEWGIWEKIDDGRLTSDTHPKKDVPSWGYSDCVSRIVYHNWPEGNHVATSHCVVSKNDSAEVFHRDAKNIMYQGLNLYAL